MEENFNLIALQYRWPPGSWDHLTIERAGRLWGALEKRHKALRDSGGAVDEEDLEA